jgi:uncharacterized membrane protein YoaK (UPF0700 family)
MPTVTLDVLLGLTERVWSDVWLLGLALAGGVLDATSYIGLGKVFTANMTGNTVLLAVALARGNGADAARSAVALGGFSVGAAIGVMVTEAGARPWPARPEAALVLEMLALAALLVLWAVVGVPAIRYALVAIAGAVMGLQSAAVRASDIRGVTTTYMTSTLLNAIARLVERVRGTPAERQGPSLPGAAWVTYGLGAMAAAFAVPSWQAGIVAVPLVIVAGVTVAGRVQRAKEDT